MTEFKVQLEDQLVQTIGYNAIEKFFSESMNQILLKISAKEALVDLKTIDLKNDNKWEIAREKAWHEQSVNYLKTIV